MPHQNPVCPPPHTHTHEDQGVNGGEIRTEEHPTISPVDVQKEKSPVEETSKTVPEEHPKISPVDAKEVRTTPPPAKEVKKSPLSVEETSKVVSDITNQSRLSDSSKQQRGISVGGRNLLDILISKNAPENKATNKK